MRNQSGFTLIELVVVIVVLGILAAVAVPKFVDLSDEAARSALEATAGSLSAASAMNYAKEKAGDGGTNVIKCSDVGPLLESGTLDSRYTIDPDTVITVGGSEECTVKHDDTTETAIFTAHYVSS